jgi:cytochrome c biogenesis protein CcdA
MQVNKSTTPTGSTDNPNGDVTNPSPDDSRVFAPLLSMQESSGVSFSISAFKESVVVLQFMQIQSDCSGNYFYKGTLLQNVQSVPQFDSFKGSCANICPEGNCDNKAITHRTVFITAIIPPGCCGDPLSFSKQFKTQFNMNWFVASDTLEYTATKSYMSYLKFGSNSALSPDPTLIFIDKQQRIESVSGYMDSSTLNVKINSLLKESYNAIGNQEFNSNSAAQDTYESNDPVTLELFGGMFVMGVLTSAAPCCIVLFVTTVTYIINVCMRPPPLNTKRKHNKQASMIGATKYGTIIGFSFTIGMALVFFIIGCILSFFSIFTQGQKIAMAFSFLTGVVLILFGLDGIGFFAWLKNRFQSKNKNKASKDLACKNGACDCGTPKKGVIERLRNFGIKLSKRYILVGSFFLGMLFGLAWVPCAVSLILPVVLLVMTQKISMLMGGLLFFVFGLGHGIPFVLIASATSAARVKITEKILKVSKWLIVIFGIIIIVLGINMILTSLGIVVMKWW